MIVAVVPNLMDRSRFSSEVRFIGSAAEASQATLALVDLDRCDDMESFASLPIRTVGFCAHVDESRIEAALAAGFDEVLARSSFFHRLPALVAGASS